MKLVFILSFIFAFLSCSSPPEVVSEKVGMERRQMSDYYSGTGIVRYFLPSIPHWANTSHSGRCQREEGIVLLDYAKLRKSLFIDYEQSVQFQLVFNQQRKQVQIENQVSYLTFQKEEEIFYEVSDQIQSNFKVFRKPKIKQVHLVWIDHALSDEEVRRRLVQLFKKESMHEGHPVFISMCLRREELMKFVRDNRLPESARYISYEMFSPFLASNLRTYGEILEVNYLFDNDQKLYLYTDDQIPFELKGNFILRKY